MVKFRFHDKNGAWIQNIDPSDDLPDEVSSMHIEGPFDSNASNCELLTAMLRSSPRKLEKISLVGLPSADESPAFLGFLVLLCNKTKSLCVSGCQLSTNAMTCLMASLYMYDGIRELRFALLSSQLPTNQAKILLEGVASSPCLEIFDFRVDVFTNSEDVSRHLINALRRNQRLKIISLYTRRFATNDFQNIIQASMIGPNVKAVEIVDQDRNLPLDVLQRVLCRADCRIEKLALCGITIVAGHEWYGSIIQNVSVTNFELQETRSDWDGIGKAVSLFKSLVELDLFDNHITQLSFLDPLLFSGKSSQLKRLDVSCNNIGQREMERFIEKLQGIRGLKHLAVACNNSSAFKSNSALTAMIDALRHNTDLEHVDLDFDSKDLPLHLNRGGRRLFESSQPLPTNLLPRVLERASRISYYSSLDVWGNPTCEAPRADVVFWMIHRLAPQL